MENTVDFDQLKFSFPKPTYAREMENNKGHRLYKWCVAQSNGVYNVKDHGATGNGQTDDTKAFQAAWNASCAANGWSTMLVPEGSYLVGPLAFKGPCKGVKRLELRGQLLASTNLNAYTNNWIDFQYIDGLIIYGGGIFNGQGALAWPHNECPKKWSCKLLPMSLVFSFVSNAVVKNISSIDSKLFHMHIFSSKNLEFQSLKISAPGNSPNTDGIHIADSTNITIANAIIGTGDDCISIGPGNTNLTILNVLCGPGHGISVGSLGKNSNEKDVVGLTVRNCAFNGTTNGLRIKTWKSSPVPLTAAHFVYENIIMHNVYNPIIIDQEYCPYVSCVEKDPSRVQIHDIKFTNVKGTSSSREAIKFVCSRSVPCASVELNDIDLHYTGDATGNATATSTCLNIQGRSNGNVKPSSCI
ncbi:exopolygalacturonase-like [Zingiber officinale]|uniref:exopolygalacturonase-like n=1 Tax=Zingiber officinale TaxID=94328 RepID=UPI001C4B0404|nr:exopolygalacturonase-like [Zingiber officinale]